ncbi:MAG: hypothetical protein RR054_04410 [Clostridia bacterium]
MKYNITYACGHTSTVEIFGTNAHGERDNQKEWYKTRLCPDCYKIEQFEIAKNLTIASNFPRLVGTEKQIEWAEKIRAKKWRSYGEKYKIYLEKFKEINAMTDDEFFENFKPIKVVFPLKNLISQELKTRTELTKYYTHKFIPYNFAESNSKYWIELEN